MNATQQAIQMWAAERDSLITEIHKLQEDKRLALVILRRVVNDWPYCAPEVIAQERDDVARFIKENS